MTLATLKEHLFSTNFHASISIQINMTIQRPPCELTIQFFFSFSNGRVLVHRTGVFNQEIRNNYQNGSEHLQ